MAQTASVAALHVVESDPPDDPTVVVKGFLAAWEGLDVDVAMAYFSPDAVFADTPTRSGGEGRDVKEFLTSSAKGATSLRTEVHGHTSFDSVVLNERTDHWTIDGADISVRVVGFFRVADGRIVSWRDTSSDAVVEAAPVGAPLADAPEDSDRQGPHRIDWKGTVDPRYVGAPSSGELQTLEAEIQEWHKRAVLWRERARTAETIAMARRGHLDDLRRVVDTLRSTPPRSG